MSQDLQFTGCIKIGVLEIFINACELIRLYTTTFRVIQKHMLQEAEP